MLPPAAEPEPGDPLAAGDGAEDDPLAAGDGAEEDDADVEAGVADVPLGAGAGGGMRGSVPVCGGGTGAGTIGAVVTGGSGSGGTGAGRGAVVVGGGGSGSGAVVGGGGSAVVGGGGSGSVGSTVVTVVIGSSIACPVCVTACAAAKPPRAAIRANSLPSRCTAAGLRR